MTSLAPVLVDDLLHLMAGLVAMRKARRRPHVTRREQLLVPRDHATAPPPITRSPLRDRMRHLQKIVVPRRPLVIRRHRVNPFRVQDDANSRAFPSQSLCTAVSGFKREHKGQPHIPKTAVVAIRPVQTLRGYLDLCHVRPVSRQFTSSMLLASVMAISTRPCGNSK